MRVKYQETSINRELYEEVHQAQLRGRVIEMFFFTESEIDMLRKELGVEKCNYKGAKVQRILGVPFKIVDANGEEVL